MNKSENTMTALVFDGQLRVTSVKKPRRKADEVLIRVTKAGICNTDHEIIRGYVPGFDGILGHEFVGIIEDSPDTSHIGKRCAGEINFACGTCEFCERGLGRHCPNRSVLGIVNQNGAFAEYLCVPMENIVFIPDALPDSKAVFIEPLSAALEIFEQLSVPPDSKVLLFGDGKLGLLIAYAFAMRHFDITVVGKHPKKLALLSHQGIRTYLAHEFAKGSYHIVIEATGNASVFETALENVRPRGTIVLKSTYAGAFAFNPSQIVVDEITLMGSRCGRFSEAVRFLAEHDLPLEKLISAEFDLHDGTKAFEHSARSDVVKVLLNVSHQHLRGFRKKNIRQGRTHQ